MKAVIIYFTKSALGGTHTPIYTGRFCRKYVGLVRAEIVEADDLTGALDMAKPRPTETVLNAVPL